MSRETNIRAFSVVPSGSKFGSKMRYFFDFRDGSHFLVDDVGLECSSVEAAKAEAAMGLAGYAKDVVSGAGRRVMAVEVRNEQGPVFKTKMVFEIEDVNA
jgi:hypothetical protein